MFWVFASFFAVFFRFFVQALSRIVTNPLIARGRLVVGDIPFFFSALRAGACARGAIYNFGGSAYGLRLLFILLI